MEISAIREYLEMFRQAVAENTTGTELRETEEGPVLYCSVKSPFEGREDIVYQISMYPYEETFFAAEIIMFVFTDIDRSKYPELNRLINRLNVYFTIGSYRLFEEEGAVMFCHGLMLDDTMQIAKGNELLAKAITVMENTAVNTGGYILRLLNGEDPDSIIADIVKEA